jgi:predicted nucleic acid-binding protein
MIRAYVDTNVFLNVWNEEIDPKSGKELWKGSKDFLKRIESGEYEGITSITTLMEIVHVFKVRGKDYNEALKDLRKLGIRVLVPDSWTMIKAFEYEIERDLDPYDSIAFAIAESAGSEIFVTRDEKLRRKIGRLIRALEPEEV